jgi:hypothetical protein
LQNLALTPNASSLNIAFTKHITNALIKIRDEKLKQKASVPKLEDGWEPIIDMHANGFDCHALCDLGASISIMPRKIYDMLDLPPLEKCYYDVPIADVAKKNLWEGLMMFLLWLIITLFPLIFLLWTLNAMLYVLLFWEDPSSNCRYHH